MKRRIRGIFLISLGLLMSISAAAIFAEYEYQAEIAGDNAEILLDALTEEIQERQELSRYDTAKQEDAAPELPKITLHPQAPEQPRTTLNGYEMVGIIHVPSVNVRLPVLDSWNYDLLKMSPCRYSGSVEGGNLILLGHNYKRHFAPLKKIKVGSRVEFCDVNGTVSEYEVAATEVLEKTELDRLTSSDYDLTLFTCTNGGYSRFVVRCNLVSTTTENAQAPLPV